MDPFWNRVFENLAEDEAVHSKRLIYPAMTSFTRFPQLPVELQLMIVRVSYSFSFNVF